jgi:aldehyde dehydrogenase (NAD+)
MSLETFASDLKSQIFSYGHIPLAVRKKRLEALKQSILSKEVMINKALKDDLGKSTFEAYATEMGFILEELFILVCMRIFLLFLLRNWQ